MAHSSTPPRAAEALLDRARRLSSNAYERTLVPSSFAEGETPRSSHLSALSPNQHRTSFNSSLLASPRRTSFVVPPRPRSTTNAPSASASRSHSSASAPSSKNHARDTSGAAQIVSAPIIIYNSSEIQEPAPVRRPAKLDPVLDNEDQRNSTATTFPNLNQPCATTDSQPPSATMSSARPRALSLESIYEARGSDDADTTQATAGHLSVVKDNRRKHLSENGTTSLVYGVLAALRQNSGLESPRIMDGTDLPMASTFPLRTAMMTASVKNITTETIEPVELQPLQPQQPQQSQQQEQVQEDQTIMHTADATNTNTAASIDTVTTATNNVEEGLKTSQEALDDTLATNKVTPLAPVPRRIPTLEIMESRSAAEEQTEVCSPDAIMESPVEDRGREDLLPSTPEQSLPVERRAPNSRSSSMNSTTSADHHDKKEGKAAFLLHRISVLRKNSFGENLKDADSSKSHSNHLSLHSKASKRSSKLLGKLVPKFLHTSPSALSSTSTSGSPGSQTGFSPFSHSNHSGSVTDQSSVHDEIMTPDSASFVMIPSPVSETHESLPFEPVVQTVQAVQEPEEVTSPTFATVVAPAFLECLRTDTKSPSLSLSSCFSGVSKTSDNSYASKPSGSSVISVYSAEEETKELTAITTGFKSQGMSGHTNAQNNEEEKGEEKEGAEGNDKATEIIHSALDDTLMSPYVIDENCDDVFFLNSVLRKKTPPTSTSSVTDSSLLSSSYTSSWTVNSNSMSSRASTPSVSGCSSASSQASTPSPTTPPQLDDQVYPFPPGHSLKSTMHMHYRSSPLPTNIQDGLDEKRTRLRDAVSEWRRSANASS